MNTIQIQSQTGSYTVHTGSGALHSLPDFIRGLDDIPSGLAVIGDRGVLDHWRDDLVSTLDSLSTGYQIFPVEPGENKKTLDSVATLSRDMMASYFDRQSLIVNFGGGMVGDLGGFVASIYMRGIPYIHVPTTLLAQMDACIGGKVGVNHGGAKNMLGRFQAPRACFLDTRYLGSLSDRHFREGISECIKHGLVRDSSFLTELEMSVDPLLNREKETLESIVFRSILCKKEVVERDENEKGYRQILNFGHTLGHAVEVEAPNGAYLHGEAVSVGMRASLLLSERANVLEDPSLVDRVTDLLRAYNLPVEIEQCDPDRLLERISYDKKGTRGTPEWVLLREAGEPVPDQTLSSDLVRQTISDLHK